MWYGTIQYIRLLKIIHGDDDGNTVQLTAITLLYKMDYRTYRTLRLMYNRTTVSHLVSHGHTCHTRCHMATASSHVQSESQAP